VLLLGFALAFGLWIFWQWINEQYDVTVKGNEWMTAGWRRHIKGRTVIYTSNVQLVS
jgi:hypothetical protein